MSSAASATLENPRLSVQQTFEGLVQEHKDRIYGYLCRLTNDSPDAEDLTQEVFIRAYQSLNAFRHDAALDTWLYRIATNLVIDRHRRQRRAPQWIPFEIGGGRGDNGEESPLDLPNPDRHSDPGSQAQLSELRARVHRAIETLPVKLRVVVVLHDMEGLSYDEVAQSLGLPLGTVKSRLFNARAMLKRKLRGYLEDSE